MAVLFSLVVMRVSGAIAGNPVFGKTNFPPRARACMIVALSVCLHQSTGSGSYRAPGSLVEYSVMLGGELLFGLVISFAMELSFMTVRFASSVMDYCMGLSMAQIYDPQYGTQSTVSSGLYYTFMALIFFATNGHLRLFSIFYTSAELIPFGTVSLRPEIMEVAAAAFCQSIVMGMQFAFPVIAMELLSEAAMGILMRVVPQINVFAVNFQVKILVGMFMFLLIFSPMADRLGVILEEMYGIMEQLAASMGGV